MTVPSPGPSPIPFIDLAAQRRRLGCHVDQAIAAVLEHGRFILGPEVQQLEEALAQFCGAREVVTCASGTDALALVLMAKGLAPGDAVLCPSFTFAATAEVVAWFGATPVFVDVDPISFNIDIESLERGTTTARDRNLRLRGVIAVDLFGQPADYDKISEICARFGMWLLADAAQSFGASRQGKKVGTMGTATATSFFPAKPLGCYGDGGAVFTDDPELAKILRSLRVHGEGEDKYDNIRIGMNGRLDTIQAAVLLEKLKIFPEECESRNVVAARYSDGLSDVAIVPTVSAENTSVWAQYTIRVDRSKRDRVATDLRALGIPTTTYYRKPLHLQPAYRDFPVAGNGLPVSELLSQEVISLPMHAYLEPQTQDRIIAAVRECLA